ncbi:hypothetical protein GCM10009616_01190 [Microlunatus lacustris]
MADVGGTQMQPQQLGRPSTRSWAVALALTLVLGSGSLAFGLAQGESEPAPVPSAQPAPRTPRTVHVATDGNDEAEGGRSTPVRTVRAAVKRSGPGDTVVVHAGTYREELKIENRPGLSLVAAPGEEVWLDGSVVVPGWTGDGSRWVSRGWTEDFDPSPTYSWGQPDNEKSGWNFVSPDHPMAAHPDQVWVDGERQLQVGSRGEIRAGTFYVDQARDELVLGTDPTGRTVTASAETRALRVRSAGMLIRGIGFRRYAPSVPHMGAITVEAPDVTFDQVRVSDNATTGMHIMSSGVQLRDVTIARNGMMGLTGTHSDDLELTRVTAEDNNLEQFNQSPAAGGVKIGRSSGVLIRDSVFAGNLANGLWFDESVHDIRLLGSRIVDNSGHGVSIELSGKAVVVDNVIARNGGNGLKANNAEDVAVWNNTFADNNRSINVVQDDRDLDPQGSFRDPDLPLTWQTQGVTIRNNIVVHSGARTLPSGPDGSRTCLLCVEDFSGRWTAAEMDVTALGNAYQRPDATSPRWVVVWARRSKDPYVFRTLDQFRQTVRQEETGRLFTGTPVLDEDLKPLPVLQRLTREIAQPLPEDLAVVTGRPAGTRHLGAWLR